MIVPKILNVPTYIFTFPYVITTNSSYCHFAKRIQADICSEIDSQFFLLSLWQ